jgi:uncharacterized protein with PIN domain
VLDAAPLIAVLRDEPHADGVISAIGQASVSVSTVTLAETVDVLERVHGWTPIALAETIEGVLGVALDFVEPTPAIAARAGSLRARHYRRRANDVSLGDCFVVATAAPGETIVTSDRALARVARTEGVDVEVVPDRSS